MSRPCDRLQRVEINLLKHLSRVSPFGSPVIVPAKFRVAVLRLWRIGLIEIWYRQDRDHPSGRPSQFITMTVEDSRRLDAILSGGEYRRLAEIQGQRENGSDQPSKPEQGQG